VNIGQLPIVLAIAFLVLALFLIFRAPTQITDYAAVVGLIFLGCQLWLQRRDQKNQAIARLFDEVVTPEFRRKLPFVYSREPENLTLQKLSQSEREIVEDVTARFDGIGFRVRTGVVPKQETLALFWDLVLRCAQQLRPHILDQRERRGASLEYKADFDWLARECKLFHLKSLGHKSLPRNLNLDKLLELEPLPSDLKRRQISTPGTRCCQPTL
jgi:hypothetical protein